MLILQFYHAGEQFFIVGLCQGFELFMPPHQWTIFKLRYFAGGEEALSRLCLTSLFHTVHVYTRRFTPRRLFLPLEYPLSPGYPLRLTLPESHWRCDHPGLCLAPLHLYTG